MKYEDEVKTKPCPQCGGRGYVTKLFQTVPVKMEAQCPVCEGYGFVIKIEIRQKEILSK